jgi:hypothetical protein
MSVSGVSITVMSLNLHEGDQARDSPNGWDRRKEICISVITNYSPTILCTQQGLSLVSCNLVSLFFAFWFYWVLLLIYCRVEVAAWLSAAVFAWYTTLLLAFLSIIYYLAFDIGCTSIRGHNWLVVSNFQFIMLIADLIDTNSLVYMIILVIKYWSMTFQSLKLALNSLVINI